MTTSGAVGGDRQERWSLAKCVASCDDTAPPRGPSALGGRPAVPSSTAFGADNLVRRPRPCSVGSPDSFVGLRRPTPCLPSLRGAPTREVEAVVRTTTRGHAAAFVALAALQRAAVAAAADRGPAESEIPGQKTAGPYSPTCSAPA